MKKLIIAACLALGITLGGLSACGHINTGGTVSPNDPAPEGQILSQGEFVGLNGKAASGTVAVYRTPDGNTVVRLNGVVFESETNLQLVVIGSDGTEVDRVGLRSTTGSQNYSLVPASIVSVTQILIYSPRANRDYAQAILRSSA